MKNTERYIEDKKFLKEELGRIPSDDEVFNFSERVAIMIHDAKLRECDALVLAANGLKK